MRGGATGSARNRTVVDNEESGGRMAAAGFLNRPTG